MACAECDPDRYSGKYDFVACVEGTVYGGCGDENCGGVCEAVGTCNCWCHQVGEFKKAPS